MTRPIVMSKKPGLLKQTKSQRARFGPLIRTVSRASMSAKARYEGNKRLLDRAAILLMLLIVLSVAVPLIYCRVTCDCSIFRDVCDAGGTGMGQGFYLPDIALIKDNGAGKSLFTGISPECVVDVESYVNRKEHTYFKNTESFYSEIATESSLAASLRIGGFTLAATLDVASSSIDSKTLSVTGMRLEVSATTGYSELKEDCMRSKSGLEMKPDFIKDFESLPANIINPHNTSSWYQYAAILATYGSHVTKRISYGSKLSNYIFAKSSQEISKKALEVKACLAVKEAHVSVCSAVTTKDYSDVQKYETSQEITVQGGAAGTRAKLINNVTAELLEQLMLEANVTRQPIAQQYLSIWEILKSRYSNTPHYIKAVNMESYYLGMLNTGCEYLIDGDQEMRKFVLVDDNQNEPGYECQLRAVGCRSDDDCHLIDVSWCACYGEGCVREKTASARHSLKTSREVQRQFRSNKWEGANEFCEYQIGPWCKCNTGGVGPDWITVWRA